MTDPIAAFMSAAASQIGTYWPKVSPYGEWYDKTYGGNKGIYRDGQFCAMGLSWAAWKAGIPATIVPPHAYTPSGVSWFRSRGRFQSGMKGIRRGDLWYSSCANLGRVSHVELVESVNKDGSVNTIGYNTSGTASGDQRNGRVVARKRRVTNCSLGGYGRPDYASITLTSQVSEFEQEVLTILGYYTGAIDGQAGPMTQNAVADFQRAHDLHPDGLIGPITQPVLAKEATAVLDKIRAIVREEIQTAIQGLAVKRPSDKWADSNGRVPLVQEVADAKTLALAANEKLDTLTTRVNCPKSA